MAKEISITHSDLESIGGINNVNIATINPEDSNSFKSANIAYTDLTAAEQTQLDDCLIMLESKIV